MKGIELSRRYFEEFGKPMLEKDFPELVPLVAAGLLGSGSECFGYDDEISRDHDYEPGFCLLLPNEDVVDRQTAFRLERAYAKLPREYMGFERAQIQPVGGSRHGVIRIADFMMEKTGTYNGILSEQQWMQLSEESLAEVTNGMIFQDHYGEITAIRSRLMYFPEDIRRKKLAGHLLLMAQAGQYNYQRCIRHHEQAAAQMAVFEFVRSTMSCVFLLNRRYQPYYKWGFHAMRALPKLALLAELLEYLITTDNEDEMAEEKYNVIESIAADVIDEVSAQGLSRAVCQDLEKHAYSVNDSIQDAHIRNMHILAGI